MIEIADGNVDFCAGFAGIAVACGSNNKLSVSPSRFVAIVVPRRDAPLRGARSRAFI